MSERRKPNARIVVFDEFYYHDDTPDDLDTSDEFDASAQPLSETFLTDDSVGASIDRERHEVIAAAHNLYDACRLLIAIKDGEYGEIDAIVMAGTLEDNRQYVENPISFTETETYIKPGLFGNKEKTRTRETFIIPTKNANGDTILPSVTSDGRERFGGLEWRQAHDRILQTEEGKRGRAAAILSQAAKELIPDTPVIIHSADVSYLKELPAVAHIRKKHIPNPESELAKAIDAIVEAKQAN